MASKTTYPVIVQPSEVDFSLRASITSMIGYVLDIAGIDADNKGFGVKILNSENRSWVLSRMAFDILRLPAEYEKIDITTWVNEYGKLMTTRNFTVADKNDTRIVAAITQWAMIDLTSRLPVDLRYVAENSNSLCADESPIERPRKVPQITPAAEFVHKVVYSDIDFNHHVNSLRYFTLMLDMLDMELLKSEKPIHIEINFLHESRYGDTLTVGYEQREAKHLFEIKNAQNTVICRASIEWQNNSE